MQIYSTQKGDESGTSMFVYETKQSTDIELTMRSELIKDEGNFQSNRAPFVQQKGSVGLLLNVFALVYNGRTGQADERYCKDQ